MGNNMEINIEEIIGEIRKEIQEKGYKETDLSFNDIPIPEAPTPLPVQAPQVPQDNTQEELKGVLDYLSANYAHDILLPFSSSNPVAGFVKKLVRKLVRFLFYPVLARQNAVNSSMISALNILAAGYGTKNETEQKIAALQEKVNALEAELNRLKEQKAQK